MHEHSTVGITGASSFLGVNVKRFLEHGRFKLRIFQGSLLRLAEVDDFVKGCNVVVHLTDPSQSFDYDMWDQLVLGAYHIARSCIKHDAEVIACGVVSDGIGQTIASGIFKQFQRVGLRSAVLAFPELFGPFGDPYQNSLASALMYRKSNNKSCSHLVDGMKETVTLLHVADACMCIENYLRIGIQAHVGARIPNKFAGQFTTTWRDFLTVMNGQKPSLPVPPRAEYFIKETLQWYKDNART